MQVTHLRRSDYRRMRWKNGLGWTTELAIAPHDADFAGGRFDWRLSIAEVDADCDFSPLPGVDRTIALLEGNGMVLRADDGEETVLDRRGQAHAFAGEAAVHCRISDGACRDFNAMTQRERFAHKLMFRPLVGPMVFFPEAQVTWAIHLAGGRAQVQNAPDQRAMEAGDTLLLQPAPGDERQVVLAGGGELVLVRLSPSDRRG